MIFFIKLTTVLANPPLLILFTDHFRTVANEFLEDLMLTEERRELPALGRVVRNEAGFYPKRHDVNEEIDGFSERDFAYQRRKLKRSSSRQIRQCLRLLRTPCCRKFKDFLFIGYRV